MSNGKWKYTGFLLIGLIVGMASMAVFWASAELPTKSFAQGDHTILPTFPELATWSEVPGPPGSKETCWLLHDHERGDNSPYILKCEKERGADDTND